MAERPCGRLQSDRPGFDSRSPLHGASMLNEFDEDISEEQIKSISERILKLSDKKIDELWYRCGFIYDRPKPAIIYEDKNKDLKALYDDALDDIKKWKEESEILETFLTETSIKEVLKNLEEIEKE